MKEESYVYLYSKVSSKYLSEYWIWPISSRFKNTSDEAEMKKIQIDRSFGEMGENPKVTNVLNGV